MLKLLKYYAYLITLIFLGWGTSFHFAPMYKDSSFMQCMARHEDFLALKLGLKKDQVCLDVSEIIIDFFEYFGCRLVVESVVL